MNIEVLGFLGSGLLGLCALPEVISSIITKKCSLGWAFLLLWFFGELFLLIYTIIKNRTVPLIPLIFNYLLNLLFLSILISIKVKEVQ